MLACAALRRDGRSASRTKIRFQAEVEGLIATATPATRHACGWKALFVSAQHAKQMLLAAYDESRSGDDVDVLPEVSG
jgi:hypothetical protein